MCSELLAKFRNLKVNSKLSFTGAILSSLWLEPAEKFVNYAISDWLLWPNQVESL